MTPNPRGEPLPLGTYAVRLICCDHDDGYQICKDAKAAHKFRDEWMASGAGESYYEHKRIGIVQRLAEPTPIGWVRDCLCLPS